MAVLFVMTLVLAIYTGVQGQRNWNFDTADEVHGPSHWKDNYPGCGGKRQSPVRINTDETVQNSGLDELVLTNYDNSEPSLTLTNNGDRVKILVNDKKPTVSGGGLRYRYEMSQFHFHWSTDNKKGSEHKLDDGEYAGELHVGHLKEGASGTEAYSDPEGIAILSVLLKAGRSHDHPGYEKIFKYLDKIQNASDEFEMPSFAIRELLPSNLKNYYRYNGSRAEPPCEEAAVWTIFQEPVVLSDGQFQRLRRLKNDGKYLLHNNRPVAPLYDRKVFVSWNKDSKDGATGHAIRPISGQTSRLITTICLLKLII